MTGPYDDIIELPHPTSAKHPRMPIRDRAAIFSPFAALSGHGAAIRETARLTEELAELAEDEAAALDRQLRLLEEHIQEQPQVRLICFQPDGRKAGGAYVEVRGRVKRMDPTAGTIALMDGREIPIRHILLVDKEDTYGDTAENTK